MKTTKWSSYNGCLVATYTERGKDSTGFPKAPSYCIALNGEILATENLNGTEKLERFSLFVEDLIARYDKLVADVRLPVYKWPLVVD